MTLAGTCGGKEGQLRIEAEHTTIERSNIESKGEAAFIAMILVNKKNITKGIIQDGS